MDIFRKRQQQSKPTLPNDIIDFMERFGRFEFDWQSSGEDGADMWGRIGELYSFAAADPDGFLKALANAVLPVGGWAAYGASRTIWELLSSTESIKQNPSYNAIMNAAIEFLRANRVPIVKVRGYEWEYWFSNGGTRDTWLLQLPSASSSDLPNSPEAWVEIGTSHYENARYSEALNAYDRAIQLNPTYTLAYVNKANLLGDMQRFEEAVMAYDRAIQLNSTDVWPYAGKGFALYRLKRYEEALAAYDHALHLAPNIARGYVDKGDVLDKLRRHEEALVAYNKALELDPTHALATANKGATLAELNRHEEALVAFNRAIQLNPADVGTWVGKGLTLIALRRFEEALDVWYSLLHRTPSNPMIYTFLGDTLFNMNRYQEALNSYNQALALEPDNINAWFKKGIILEYFRRYEEALMAYDYGFDRNDIAHWNAHARVYRALGRMAEAIEAERHVRALGG